MPSPSPGARAGPTGSDSSTSGRSPTAPATGEAITQDPLRELAEHDDPIIRLWALYTLAESSRYNTDARRSLEAARSGPDGELAALLLDAHDAQDDAHRVAALDAATRWVRDHHPGARAVWSGWKRGDDGFIQLSDPDDAIDGGPEASGAPGRIAKLHDDSAVAASRWLRSARTPGRSAASPDPRADPIRVVRLPIWQTDLIAR